MSTTQSAHREPTHMLHIRIPDEARDAIAEALSVLGNPELDPDRALTLAHKAFATLDIDRLQDILDFGRHADTPGVALVENLPQDDKLPPTPNNGGPCEGKPTFVAEGVLLGLSSLLGEPTSFVTEKNGRLIHDIVPTESGATTQTSEGSDVFLNFHNDIVHDESGRYDLSNPDFLVLNCLRKDREGNALTSYADARDIVHALSDEVVDILRSASFQLNAPGGYTRAYADGKEVLSVPVPLLGGPEESPEIYVAANGVKRLTPEADHAFSELQRVCREPEVGQVVALTPGSALLVNNRKGVHSRSRFDAHFDGADRWLQRTYTRRSLWAIRSQLVPGSRRTHR
ncbi:TauD/TfdA family dioxygenase [Streptomyces gilvosporeus]|uniref:Oxygenase n=1 Tax=Streptomyces gilvosporeus TaxID=553510 RepID=A0A1V0U0Q1_9ACTN|nr:TauD/TfdA family dioxygenase [Streptomyces gilvosporeus]ARF58795.1 oxygenase [Streptomyces gilvosporeus]